MSTILASLAMWALFQALVVWFCARLGAVRDLDVEDRVHLEDFAARKAPAPKL
jgi:hypothetical protein